ncbi:MAG: hypothetical protein U5N10_17745 [Gemmobacter sp.]|nr:hypothetical protein [Gemmobacter sp.]
MGLQHTFHAPHGGADFLGWRKNRHGNTEIVYDDGVARRMIWRVASRIQVATPASARGAAACGAAAIRVVPTLYDELKKRAIAIERIAWLTRHRLRK